MGYHRDYREIQLGKLVKKNKQSQLALAASADRRRRAGICADKSWSPPAPAGRPTHKRLTMRRSGPGRLQALYRDARAGHPRHQDDRQEVLILNADTYFMAPSLAQKLLRTA